MILGGPFIYPVLNSLVAPQGSVFYAWLDPPAFPSELPPPRPNVQRACRSDLLSFIRGLHWGAPGRPCSSEKALSMRLAWVPILTYSYIDPLWNHICRAVAAAREVLKPMPWCPNKMFFAAPPQKTNETNTKTKKHMNRTNQKTLK